MRKKGTKRYRVNIARFSMYVLILVICIIIAGVLVGRFIVGTEPDNEKVPDPIDEYEEEQTVDLSQWNLVLVNGQNGLPLDYVPPLKEVGNGYQFDERAADSLTEMLAAARGEGLSPIICSSYRSIDRQTELYQKKVNQYLQKGHTDEEAGRLAATVVAYPGTSEHNLGLAVDIVAVEYQLLDDAQGDTAESIWLRENCHKFGFILRYPEDKQDITGVIYEPWHFRYVGIEAATEIMENNLCLEEYHTKYSQ